MWALSSQAHKMLLSACSDYFQSLFRDSSQLIYPSEY